MRSPSGELTGYADKLSAAPGEEIGFMVSTTSADYEATIVRLRHGDTNPAGPGFKETVVRSSVDGRHRGQLQVTRTGSYVLVQASTQLQVDSFTLQAWVLPTRPTSQRHQGLLSHWSEDAGPGFGLFIDPNGLICFLFTDGDQDARLATTETAVEREWAFVAATFDLPTRTAALYTSRLSPWAGDGIERASLEVGSLGSICPPPETPFRIGASSYAAEDTATGSAFDGKIDRPRMFGRALGPSEIEELARGASAADLASGELYAAWDFAADQSSTVIRDAGSAGLHGVGVNMPARGVTGHNWSGEESDFRLRAEEYAAIHFHSDDLEDAAWERSIEWQVPGDLSSGIYALRVRSGGLEDHIPFVVRPARGASVCRVAFLLPTMTYLAYANERMGDPMQPNSPAGWPSVRDPLDDFLEEHPEFGKSLYDVHDDRSGVRYSSYLRPIPSLRPRYRFRFLNAPRHFGADLYVVDWLDQIGVDHDVITDHDLHEGRSALGDYRVLITGGHPEYMTSTMLADLEAWVANGGRLMYLGGNGCYWVTSVHRERPHVIEVRRGLSGSRAWESEPGELHHSTTGELGGLWRHRGLLPNRLLGVGFGAEGVDGNPPAYQRSPESYDQRVAWVFDGVGADSFGLGGLVLGGAAGDELDRADRTLGTPAETVVLASAQGFGPAYAVVPEDDVSWRGHRVRGEVRADVTLTENPRGGAVFSVGSISWSASLSELDSAVSRITENVLRRFSGGEP